MITYLSLLIELYFSSKTRILVALYFMELHVCTNLPKFVELLAQGPHSHILMTGGGGPSDFLGLKFWPEVIFLGL